MKIFDKTLLLLIAGAVLQATVLYADPSENFDDWGPYDTWGCYTNTDNWVIYGGRIKTTTKWSEPVSSPHSGWLADIDDNTNSWVRSGLLQYGAGLITYRCLDKAAGWNLFAIQYSTNDSLTWFTSATVSNVNNVETNWSYFTNRIDIIDPVYVRILKTDDGQLNQYLGLDNILIYNAPGVEFLGLTNLPASPTMEDEVDIYVNVRMNVAASNFVLRARYRIGDVGPYASRSLVNVSNTLYRMNYPIPAGYIGTVYYYVEAEYDGLGTSPVLYPLEGSDNPRSYVSTGSASTPDTRQMGPSSRMTGLIISEIMYHPTEWQDGINLEYIEVFNTEPVDIDISGYRITGDIDYTFPEGTWLQARKQLLVAKDPASVQFLYPVTLVYGPYDGSLPNGGGTVRLRNQWDALWLEVEYEDKMPWPIEADGGGHSLVLSKPDYGENDARAWSASARIGGSPGYPEYTYTNVLDSVVINEILAHTDLPQVDFIELYNYSTQSVDISGCILTDDPDTNRFIIPGDTILSPQSFVCYYQTNMGFSLKMQGDDVYLINSNKTYVIDAVRFNAQSNGVSIGRYPDGNPSLHLLASLTPGETNSGLKTADIVISEIMFHPISGYDDDEYVELYNRSSNDVDVSYWRFTDGIDFRFAAGTVIPSEGYLVVAKNLTNMLAKYPQLNTTNTVGDYGGGLSDRGERLELARPDDIALPDQDFVVVDEVTYNDGWGQWADGGGSSLELKDMHSDNRLGMNWAGSDETQKAPWTIVDYTDEVSNGSAENGGTYPYTSPMEVVGLTAGEYLVDDIVMTSGPTNYFSDDFESGGTGWTFSGSHYRSAVESGGGYGGSTGLHIRACDRGEFSGTYPFFENHAQKNMIIAPQPGAVARIQAKVRWLCGFPFLRIGCRGYWCCTPGDLALPPDLGSPGMQNSRYATNAGPAIEEVTQDPVLPRVGSNVVVTCRVGDPDGVTSVSLRYRTDPSYVTNTTPMYDNGAGVDSVAGDGIYSASITGQVYGTLIAFVIDATDGAAQPATSRFPTRIVAPGAPAAECLVGWGLTKAKGIGMPTYRVLITAANNSVLSALTYTSKQVVDCTFLYEDSRAVYCAAVRGRGNASSSGNVIKMPKDNRILGATKLTVLNGGYYYIISYMPWACRELGEPSGRPQPIAYAYGTGGLTYLADGLAPSTELCSTWFGDDDPEVFKNIDYSVDAFGMITNRFGMKKSRYAALSVKRSMLHPNDDYTQVFKIANAAGTADTAKYIKRVNAVIDVRCWASYFALSGLFGDWDKYGYAYSHNYYIYTPRHARSQLMLHDMDLAFDSIGVRWPTGNEVPSRMFFITPAFKRVYWAFLKDAADGPLLPERTGKFYDDIRTIGVTNGLDPGDPSPYKTSVATARASVLSGLAGVDAPFAITSNGGADFSTDANPLTLAGTAPVHVEDFYVNGHKYTVDYPTLTTWQFPVWLEPGANVLMVTGYDHGGNLVSNDTITVTYTGAVISVDGKLVINEIMYNPAVPYASYVELHNISANTLSLGGLRIDGIDADIGYGYTIAPTGYVVIAGNIPGYQCAYTNAEVVVDEFKGTLDNGGETLRLLRPEGTNAWVEIDRVRYDNDLPWPALADGQGCSLQLIDAARDNNRAGNWAVSTNRPFTPGEANSVSTNLPEFPTVWINEIMPTNMGFAADNEGEYEPWIELYNSDSNSVDLSAQSYYLTDSYTNLTKWAIPAGWTIASNGMLIIWADGETAETTNGYLHAGFRMNSESGCVALVRQPDSTPIIVDYVNYSSVPINYSYGKYPEGEQYSETYMETATPGSANTIATVPVNIYINEWMARNSLTIVDPTDGKFEDWFELYNAGEDTVNLTGYTLTDDLTDTNQFTIPVGVTIGARDFLFVWADGDDDDNGPGVDLHVNFSLAADGETIGLYKPDGTLVDAVIFGAQAVDITEGCWRDGNPNIYTLTTPTPGSSNVLLIITSFVAPTGDVATVTWSTEPGRKYRAEYITDLTGTNWVLMGIVTALTDSCWFDDTNVVGVPYKFYRLKRLEF